MKYPIPSHVMLSVPFSKDRVKFFLMNRHTQSHNRHRHRHGQVHRTAFRKTWVQTHTTFREWRHGEHEVVNSHLHLLLVKWLKAGPLFLSLMQHWCIIENSGLITNVYNSCFNDFSFDNVCFLCHVLWSCWESAISLSASSHS